MIGFLYIVGVVVSFIVFAYFDVKGNVFFGMKPRVDERDTDIRSMFGGLGCLAWPLSLALIVITLFYRGLIALFSREPKKLQVWTCPMIKPATGYRDPIKYCAVKAKSVKRPKCGVHHCDMEPLG